jgi:hypothetical protein
MPVEMAYASQWVATLAATARGALDQLKTGLDVHLLLRPALGSLANQPYLNQGAQGLGRR